MGTAAELLTAEQLQQLWDECGFVAGADAPEVRAAFYTGVGKGFELARQHLYTAPDQDGSDTTEQLTETLRRGAELGTVVERKLLRVLEALQDKLAELEAQLAAGAKLPPRAGTASRGQRSR